MQDEAKVVEAQVRSMLDTIIHPTRSFREYSTYKQSVERFYHSDVVLEYPFFTVHGRDRVMALFFLWTRNNSKHLRYDIDYLFVDTEKKMVVIELTEHFAPTCWCKVNYTLQSQLFYNIHGTDSSGKHGMIQIVRQIDKFYIREGLKLIPWLNSIYQGLFLPIQSKVVDSVLSGASWAMQVASQKWDPHFSKPLA